VASSHPFGAQEAVGETVEASLQAGAAMVTHLQRHGAAAAQGARHRGAGRLSAAPGLSAPPPALLWHPSRAAPARPLQPCPAAPLPRRPPSGLIADGVHVHPQACALALRAAPEGIVLRHRRHALWGSGPAPAVAHCGGVTRAAPVTPSPSARDAGGLLNPEAAVL